MGLKILQLNHAIQNSNLALKADKSDLSKIVRGTITPNPGGNNYVDITVSNMATSSAPMAINGDYNAWAGSVTSVRIMSDTTLRVYLSAAVSTYIRINYWYWKDS